MITPKIKALFQFIEYLHSNIDNFNEYNDLINELELLQNERQKVHAKRTFKEKLRYDEIQAELVAKFKLLQENTANLIKVKATELKVCSFENEPEYSWSNVETEILELKGNFSIEDIPEIFKYKSQYIEYRTKTHRTFLSMQFFFDELDEVLKELFDYFKENDQNEFEPFETKKIEVKSIQEALKLLRPDIMKIEQKIHYYQMTKWNITFRTLHHTVITVCDFLRPIAPEIDPLRYIEFFLNKIDFDEIEDNEDRKQNLKYCDNIFYGLESILRADVGKYILEYQQRISNLSNTEIKAVQRELITIIGNLNLQTQKFEKNINFSKYFLDFREVVKTKESLFSLDYQFLILKFNETIAVQLLNSYQIILDTINQIEPLTQPTSQQTETLKPNEVKSKHPQHNPNDWNLDCYNLFMYLFDNYYDGTKRQLTNIWFYLNENRQTKYVLKATKDTYKSFIKAFYNIEIKNFDKAHSKYVDKEYPTMDEHRQRFEVNLN